MVKGGRSESGVAAASDQAEAVRRASEDGPSLAREVLERSLEQVREQRADGLLVIVGVPRGVHEEVGETRGGDPGEVEAHRGLVLFVRDHREGAEVDRNHRDGARRRFFVVLGVLFRE